MEVTRQKGTESGFDYSIQKDNKEGINKLLNVDENSEIYKKAINGMKISPSIYGI